VKAQRHPGHFGGHCAGPRLSLRRLGLEGGLPAGPMVLAPRPRGLQMVRPALLHLSYTDPLPIRFRLLASRTSAERASSRSRLPHMSDANDDAGARNRDSARALSHRRRAVLELVAVGLGNDQIATRMRVSTQAVAYHVARLMGQFQAGNRAALVAKAYHHRVLAPEDWPPRVGRYHHCYPAGIQGVDDARCGNHPPSSTVSEGARLQSADASTCAS